MQNKKLTTLKLVPISLETCCFEFPQEHRHMKVGIMLQNSYPTHGIPVINTVSLSHQKMTAQYHLQSELHH